MRRLATRFRVGRATVERLIARQKRDGTLDAHPTRGRAPEMPPEHHALLAGWLRGDPSLRQVDLAARYGEATGRAISRTTAGRTLRRMGYTYKKSR